MNSKYGVIVSLESCFYLSFFLSMIHSRSVPGFFILYISLYEIYNCRCL